MIDPRVSFGPGLATGAAVLEALDAVRPVIRLGAGLDRRAATAAGVLYSLLVRLHPHTVLDGDGVLTSNPWRAERVADLPARLAAARPRPTRDPTRDIVIGVGSDVEGAELWLGGDDWTADVGRRPRPAAGARLGVGLHAAAALIAAEVTKIVLGPMGMPIVSFGDSLVWNLLDYRLAPAPESPDRPLVALPAVVWFGAGSVGSSAAGVVSCVEDLTGTADVVDPDGFDPARNPFRYPASAGTEHGAKAIWVATMLASAGWATSPLVGGVGDWVASRPEPGLGGIAVSSVDRVDGRLQVADALVATTLSVGVGGLALHLEREHTFDDWACPYCQYCSLAPPMGQVEVIANQVGLPVGRVARLYLGGELLSAEDVAMAVAAQRIRPERADELVGRRVDDLVRRAYAEALVPQPEAEPAAVSAPYVSWMGGVLIAAELVKAALGVELVDRRVDLDLSGVPLGVVRRRPRDSTGHCVCTSPWRRRWATRLYGEPWNPQTTTCERALTPADPTGRGSTAPIGD